MKKRLAHLDPLQAGKVLAALYFGLSLCFVPFALLFMIFAASIPQQEGHANPFGAMAGMGFVTLILLPVFYTLVGFIAGVIIAVVYNLAAKFTGGLEMTFVDVAPALPAQVSPLYPNQP